MKKLLFLSVVALSSAFVSFAGNPDKPAKPTSTSAETETQSGTTLFWYEVTYDASHPSGYIPSGTPLLVEGERAEAEDMSECSPGNVRDCVRGFSSQPTLPTSNPGTDQIKKGN